jgi:D-glycero-D-manno-heptose 1,7-bisphosphate phosphatase
MSVEEFIILPTVIDALKMASDKGYKIIIITNQGGLAKGLYSEQEVFKMHSLLRNTCQESNVEITGIYYSPHHPEFGNSLTRKPGSLLMERAIAKHHIDTSQSVMIGDRERDVQCAEAVGVRGILIPRNGQLLDYVNQLN